MSNDAALHYQQAAARGASPLGQIVALYDTILRDFLRGLAALKAGNVEARVFELNHAISVIGYLQAALDHEHGGAAAKQFERLYRISVAMIVAANTRATAEPLEQLMEMYGGLRQAWYEADQKLEADARREGSTATRMDAAKTPTPNPLKVDVEIPQRHWST